MTIIKKYKLFLENKENDVIEKILNNCKPFIETLKKCEKGKLFYRGTWDDIDEIKLYKKPKYREPKDTPYEIHEELNYLFEKKFGWKGRDGVFAFSGEGNADDYGFSYIFFPIGYSNYLWNPNIDDLYGKYEAEMTEYNLEYDDDDDEELNDLWEHDCVNCDDKKEKEKFIEDILNTHEKEKNEIFNIIKNIIDDYKSTDICNIKTQEIMFNCQEYYLISNDYYDEIYKMIWE